jgi:D-alanyl-lipoteichoic acid acyltransferase DltB (MBOAT superfamily)
MLFHSLQFLVFLAVVVPAFYLAPRRARKCLLVAASYWFYGSWNWRFIPLLAGLTALDYVTGILLEASRRRWVLVMSLCANLGMLGFFKYYNFLAPASWRLDIVLPIGISFHTFQSIAYIVDVYRGEQKAIRNPLDYALFICFFPQLVSGPIVRAGQFFGDLARWRPPSRSEVADGLLQMVTGLTKKMAFADQFAKVADTFFRDPSAYPGFLPAWSGVLAFGLQIYFDFSGYTDMAIGMARLLGFHFPVNFRRPYLAASMTDFWRRWHISLSSWLRDYLWMPLGANRHGRARTVLNLGITMLLGGLWHGANWTFVVWGAYHGLLLGLEYLAGWRVRSRILTFVLANLGWVLFRSTDLRQSLDVFARLFHGPVGGWILEPWHAGLAALSLAVAWVEERYALHDRLVRGPAWAYAAAGAGMLLVLELFGVIDASIPFVYFQF